MSADDITNILLVLFFIGIMGGGSYFLVFVRLLMSGREKRAELATKNAQRHDDLVRAEERYKWLLERLTATDMTFTNPELIGQAFLELSSARERLDAGEAKKAQSALTNAERRLTEARLPKQLPPSEESGGPKLSKSD